MSDYKEIIGYFNKTLDFFSAAFAVMGLVIVFILCLCAVFYIPVWLIEFFSKLF